MSRKLVFLDTETTGLDTVNDELVELTYVSDSMYRPRTLYFGVESVHSFIDSLIKFTERGIAGKKSHKYDINNFLEATEGATLVAANPAFDAAFLKNNDLWSFHYRMLDIETYAMAKLGLDQVPSMHDIYQTLVGMGYDITEPDHTSLNDVLALQQSFHILEKM